MPANFISKYQRQTNFSCGEKPDLLQPQAFPEQNSGDVGGGRCLSKTIHGTMQSRDPTANCKCYAEPRRAQCGAVGKWQRDIVP